MLDCELIVVNATGEQWHYLLAESHAVRYQFGAMIHRGCWSGFYWTMPEAHVSGSPGICKSEPPEPSTRSEPNERHYDRFE